MMRALFTDDKDESSQDSSQSDSSVLEGVAPFEMGDDRDLSPGIKCDSVDVMFVYCFFIFFLFLMCRNKSQNGD